MTHNLSFLSGTPLLVFAVASLIMGAAMLTALFLSVAAKPQEPDLAPVLNRILTQIDDENNGPDAVWEADVVYSQAPLSLSR